MELGSHLWDCCRKGQKDMPAGSCWQKISSLAWLARCCWVNLSKQGYCLQMIWLSGESSLVVRSHHEGGCCCFYPLEASNAPATASRGRRWRHGRERPVAFPADLRLPLQPRACKPRRLHHAGCLLSQHYPSCLSGQETTRYGYVGSALFHLGWKCFG